MKNKSWLINESKHPLRNRFPQNLSLSLKHGVQYCPLLFDMLGRKKMDQEHFKLVSCTKSCKHCWYLLQMCKLCLDTGSSASQLSATDWQSQSQNSSFQFPTAPMSFTLAQMISISPIPKHQRASYRAEQSLWQDSWGERISQNPTWILEAAQSACTCHQFPFLSRTA